MAVNLQTEYLYKSGGFDVTWNDPNAAAAPKGLGTTEDGIRVAIRKATAPITEDRLGETVVDELFLGIQSMIVTIESLTWTVESLNIFRNAFPELNSTALGQYQANPVGYPIVNVNSSSHLAGPLVLTAISGMLAEETPAALITFPLAVPIEDVDLLFTLKAPIKIPFGFRVYPDVTDAAGAVWFTATGTAWD